MITAIELIVGFLFLFKGGELVVQSASNIAKKLNVNDYIIGLTLVAFGTSLPELVINVIASINNKPDIVMGNIIGSNIANTCLILGIACLIYPLLFKKKELKPNIIQNLMLYLLLCACIIIPLQTFSINKIEGLILLIISALYIFQLFKKKSQTTPAKEKIPLFKTSSIFILGIILLPIGGDLTIQASIKIATALSLSEALIAIIALSIGSSLPELTTTIIASVKQKSNMAIGNIIGSNILNIGLILAISSLINPIKVNPIFTIDLSILILSIAFLIVLILLNKKNKLNRYHGGLLLFFYIAYISFVVLRG